jgi:hypothetical protein
MPTTLLVLFGPVAVGKMTIGQVVCEKTGFKLFHNHMTIDPLRPIFEFGSPAMQVLVPEFRYRVMEEAAKNQLPGLVHTCVWAFQKESDDTPFMGRIKAMVESHGGRVCFVELQASQEIRKERQVSENRRKHKPGNVARGPEGLVGFERSHQLDSAGRFPFPENYLRIENDHLPPEGAADRICQHFGLRPMFSGTQ